MIAGLGITFYYMATTQPWLRGLFGVTGSIADNTWWGISAISAGLWGVPLGLPRHHRREPAHAGAGQGDAGAGRARPLPEPHGRHDGDHRHLIDGNRMIEKGPRRCGPFSLAGSEQSDGAGGGAGEDGEKGRAGRSRCPRTRPAEPRGTFNTRCTPIHRRKSVWQTPTIATIAITGTIRVAPATITGIAP